MHELAKEEIPSLQFLLDWLKEPVEFPLSLEAANQAYLLMHPRISFVKNLPYGTVLLDVGAGDGGLVNFKEWLAFTRSDISFLGISLSEGNHSSKYDEFFVCNLETDKPNFIRPPTAIIMSHFLEHIRNPKEIFAWASDLLPPGGRIFVEWPASHTVELPSRGEFIKHGYDVTTINFNDDHTHLVAYEVAEVCQMLVDAHLDIRAAGFVDMPYMADLLKQAGLAGRSQYELSMALWLKTLFAAYVVGIKGSHTKQSSELE